MPCYPTNALDALRMDNIDIAFLNIEIPLMDGIRLAEQLLELKPDPAEVVKYFEETAESLYLR